MGQSRRPEKREREEDTVCSSVTEWLATPGPLSCVQPTRRAYSVSTRFGPIGHPIHPLKALLHRTYRVQSERETDRDGERILSCRRAQLVRLLLRTADWNERGGYEPIGRKVCHRSASLPYPRSCCLYLVEIFRSLSFLIFLNFFQLFLSFLLRADCTVAGCPADIANTRCGLCPPPAQQSRTGGASKLAPSLASRLH